MTEGVLFIYALRKFPMTHNSVDITSVIEVRPMRQSEEGMAGELQRQAMFSFHLYRLLDYC